jgi:HEAT repeat protein
MIRGRRTTPAALALAIVAGVAAAASALAAPARETVPPRLRQLVAGARVVVAGRVEQVATYDSGRLALATVAVTRILKGDDPGGRVQIVEMRSLPSTPALFAEGEPVLAFLGPASRGSYLRQQLPEGAYLEASAGRASVLASPDPVVIDEAARLVGRIVEASRAPEPDAAKRRLAERALVFDALAARHPALVEDGIAGLADLKPLEPLSDEESARLAAAIERDDLPSRVRERLFASVASLGLKTMVPALQRVTSRDAAVTGAAWAALRALGATPDADQVAERLKSTDAKVRIAAARELVARDPSAELERAARLATDDPETEVRVAVVDALSATRSPVVIVVLERAFVDRELEVRQAAGRGIFQIGGRPAQESLARLAFTATPEMQRQAVVLLRATGIATDDPLLVRIAEQHPDAEVREVAKHGLPIHEH